MRRATKGFTLIELMLVVMIIALLIVILVPVIPAVMARVRSYQTRNIIASVETGMEQYKSVYGSYMGVYWWGRDYGYGSPKFGSDYAGGVGVAYANSGAHSCFVALQGPEGLGWKASRYGINKEFGPFFESNSANVIRTTMYNGTPGGEDFDAVKPVFADAFARRIIYQKANLDGSGANNQPKPYGFWGFGDMADRQRNAQGDRFWMSNFSPQMDKLLTQAIRPDGTRLWHNPRTFILWSAGADGCFGYWVWNTDIDGYDYDTTMTHTDDIFNFGDFLN